MGIVQGARRAGKVAGVDHDVLQQGNAKIVL
jgi:hypothetical protein